MVVFELHDVILKQNYPTEKYCLLTHLIPLASLYTLWMFLMFSGEYKKTSAMKWFNGNPSVIGQKGSSQYGGNKKQNMSNFLKKRTFLLTSWYGHTQKYVCVSGVRNVRFSENLGRFVFLIPPFWDSPFCLITDELEKIMLATSIFFKEHAFKLLSYE